MKAQEIGKWSFLVGVLISLLAAFLTGVVSTSVIITILFVLGLIVGFLNVSRKEIITFLVAVLVLLTLGVGGISALENFRLEWFHGYLSTALASFIAFVGAAGLIVAIRGILATNPGLEKIGLRKK